MGNAQRKRGLHLCFRDQAACRKIPPQTPPTTTTTSTSTTPLASTPPPPSPLQAFRASTLHNITGSLCSSFSSTPGRAEPRLSEAAQPSSCRFSNRDDPELDRKPFIFHNEPTRRDAVCIPPPRQSCHVASSLCASSEKRKSDPCNPLVYRQSSELPPPDGR